MYPELKDKVVLITGASGALGSVVARYFYAANARLALVDRQQESLQKRYEDLDTERIFLVGDISVTDRSDVEWLVQEIVKKFGTIDVLLNIVGAFRMGTPVHETPEDIWDLMMDVNAKSAFLMSSIAGRVMVGAGQGGRIINIGAKAALSGGAQTAAYGASKAAVLRLTESMAAELKGSGITINAVIPSIIDTEANRRDMPNADFNKWVKPESLAGVIGFLASDAARDITGATIPVYGGV
jgi:NAD(P)-dependent dehydrogenase (short-subunit alcohol dehydrogenase family)